jgi:hypothetical protein
LQLDGPDEHLEGGVRFACLQTAPGHLVQCFLTVHNYVSCLHKAARYSPAIAQRTGGCRVDGQARLCLSILRCLP